MNKKNITIAYGDGIGPEIMESTIAILKEAGAQLSFETIEVGKNIYEKGFTSGLMPSAWESLNNSRVLLKAPITTPQGGGYKSLNVTMRKKLGLFANVRPVASLHPFVATNFSKMDLVIIRENEEDLYMGIEYRQSAQTYQCLKIVTREGCEKIVRFAFEYAIANGRKKVTCFSKDNIMKMTDGLFHKVFNEIAAEYPSLQNDHYIIDIGTARLAAKPEIFDVIVTMNLYGDIISDVAAEISGSVGLAGSANIGKDYAMFEAIHGSAPDIAGKDIANPTGLLNAAVMMLVHIGQYSIAEKIRNAVYKTLEDGVHTADIYNSSTSKKKVGTKEFTQAVIARLGQEPVQLAVARFAASTQKENSVFDGTNNSANTTNKVEESPADSKTSSALDNIVKHNEASSALDNVAKNSKISSTKNNLAESRSLIGFDLFIEWQQEFSALIDLLNKMESEKFEIKTISAKGLLLWPLSDKHMAPNFSKGQTILRFIGKKITGKSSNEIIDTAKTISHENIVEMLNICIANKIDFVKYEGLYLFDGKAGYTSGQGE